MNELNVRQNILVKNTMGLSKFVKTIPLFVALNIKSIQHLKYLHKLAFKLTKKIYDYLEHYYGENMASA